jgi:hypothetical protein
VPEEVFQEPDGVVSGGKDPGLGLGGVLAQADRAAVAAPPVLIDQLVQQMRGDAGDFFHCGADRLGDQLQRVSSRTAARIWVESVRCVVRSRTRPASLRRATARSRRRSARSPSARRSRKSASTLWWKPGSSSSMAKAYLKSTRQRTASAACRSDRPSRNCRTQTVAS